MATCGAEARAEAKARLEAEAAQLTARLEAKAKSTAAAAAAEGPLTEALEGSTEYFLLSSKKSTSGALDRPRQRWRPVIGRVSHRSRSARSKVSKANQAWANF